MKVKNLKAQLEQLDDEMEILYSEPIIGALVSTDWKISKNVFIQTKDGYWYTENEFKELKDAGEKFDSDILIKKEQAYIEEEIPGFDSNLFDFENDVYPLPTPPEE